MSDQSVIPEAGKQFHLHLVSDATGETIHSVARACLAQFEGVEPHEHHWTLVRTTGHVEKVLASVSENPGVVMFTIVNDPLRTALQDGCRRLGVPCIPVLDPVIGTLASYLGLESRGEAGRQHVLDSEYFERIDAMTFALNHDDGQSLWNLGNADIILVGVSRTSKTPTSMYLANRGIKAANVPLVPGVDPPPELFAAAKEGPLVIGLTKTPERLIQLRRNRLRLLAQDDTDYVDPETVRAEVAAARRLFAANDWPVVDVTRRSIEETAAAILQVYERENGVDE
ncbi:MAG: kinase/pyrophosphorylase [Alphaproteobacteria bacterium]|nr:kinase/pyrophosphorylase [Alphaproteobacteria bacterium]